MVDFIVCFWEFFVLSLGKVCRSNFIDYSYEVEEGKYGNLELGREIIWNRKFYKDFLIFIRSFLLFRVLWNINEIFKVFFDFEEF